MLTLELAITKIHQFTPEQREEVIKFIEFIDHKYNQQIKEKNQFENDLDDTPDEIIIDGIKEGLKLAINAQTIQLSNMWEGIDVE